MFYGSSPPFNAILTNRFVFKKCVLAMNGLVRGGPEVTRKRREGKERRERLER